MTTIQKDRPMTLDEIAKRIDPESKCDWTRVYAERVVALLRNPELALEPKELGEAANFRLQALIITQEKDPEEQA